MRKLVTSINITLDGFVDHDAVVADAEHHDYATELLEKAEMVVLGRNTHDLFEKHWPRIAEEQSGTPAENAFARKLESLVRVVVSSTKAGGVDLDEVARLRATKGRPMVVLGSPTLTRSLLDAKLVDECHFCIQPIVLGNGRTFPHTEAQKRIDLKHEETETLRSGVTVVRYRPR